MKKLLFTILLFAPSLAFAQFTTHQGGTGLVDISTGSIPFGSVFNIRMGTSSALQFDNSLSKLTVTNASTTNVSVSSLTSGNCVQAGTGGLLTTTGAACGSSSSSFGTSSLSALFPIIYTQSASLAQFSFGGLTTSSPAVVSNIPYFTGVNTFGNVATTSVSCSGNASCTSFTVIGSSPITISASGGGGSGTVSTSTNETAGFLSYWTSNSATPALLGKVATGTVSAGNGITVTAGQSIIGTGLTITNTGLLSYDPFTHPATGQSATTSTMIFTTGGLVINAASSTIQGNLVINGNSTTTNATTSALAVSTLTSGNCVQVGTGGNLINSPNGACGSATGLSSYDAFTHGTQFGQFFSGTSTLLHLTGSPYSLSASNTSQFDNSTTTIATIGTLYIDGSSAITSTTTLFAAGINGQILGLSNGSWIPISTTTAGTGLSYTGSAFTLASIAANSVLGNSSGAAAIPSAVGTTSLYTGSAGQVLGFLSGAWIGTATSTLYGTCTGGQVVGWSNATGGLTCIATSTGSGGTVTSITNGGGLDFSVSPITTTGTITAQVGTSSVPTVSNLAYWTGNGTPSQLGSVATTSETCTSPLSCTAHAVLTGGGAISLGVVGYANGGTGTTTAPVSQLIYGGATAYQSVATGTVTCSGTASCGAGSAVVGSNLTITGTGISAYDAWTHTSVFGQTTSATSTLIALTGTPASLAASSTSYFDRILVGTSTTGALSTSTFNGNLTVANNASTTALTVSNAGGVAGCAQFTATGFITNIGSACGTAGAFDPFTHPTSFGTAASATSTLMLLTGGLSASSTVRFGTTGVTSQFTWLSSTGLLGIGTSTPQWQLTIASSTGPQMTLTDGSQGGAPLNFRWFGTSLMLSTSSPTTFATSTPPIMVIDSSQPASLSIGSTTQTLTSINGLLTQGSNGANGSSTVSAGKYQIDAYTSNGTRYCMWFAGTNITLATSSGACNP